MADPCVNLLCGPHAGGVLTTAIRDCGADIDDLRLIHVRPAPGGGVRAKYGCEVRHPDGRRTRDVLVAATGEYVPAGATVVAGEHLGHPVEVGVWRLAQDPGLPALQIVEDRQRLVEMFAAQGVTLAGQPTIVVRAYRPAQRAVLEVSDGRSRWYLKVVRPAAAAGLRARHDLLSARLPVPPVLAESSDGLLLLPEAPGMLLRDNLIGDAHPSPAPAELEKLLDALPDDVMQLPLRRPVLQRVADSAELLRTCAESDPVVPGPVATELASEAARLAEQILTASPASTGARVPVHGDFYHNQLLVDGPHVTGVLDIDTTGPGERADEWATLIGYLSVLGVSHAAARNYRAEVLAHAEQRVAPSDLRARTAAVVLGMATAPFRARLPGWPRYAAQRLALARGWLNR